MRKFTKYPKQDVNASENAANSNIFVWDGKSKVPEDVVRVEIQYGIDRIPDRAFCWRKDLISVDIPSTITVIGDEAFAHCWNLTRINLPDSVTTIGNDAFYNCDSLTSVTIPDSVTTLGSYAFSGCSSLTGVTIPDNVSRIEPATFDGCHNLTSVHIGHSVKQIGSFAFGSCSRLTRVVIPDSVISIEGTAFFGCKNLNDPDTLALITSKQVKKTRQTNWYTKMRNTVLRDELDGILAYDSEYAERIDDIYQAAAEELKSKYPELFIESSIQAGQGGVFAEYSTDDGVIRGHWDFESECDEIEDLVANCTTLAQFRKGIYNMLDRRISSM